MNYFKIGETLYKNLNERNKTSLCKYELDCLSSDSVEVEIIDEEDECARFYIEIHGDERIVDIRVRDKNIEELTEIMELVMYIRDLLVTIPEQED